MLATNQALIESRWPLVASLLNQANVPASTILIKETPEQTLLIDGIHLSSAYDPKHEAELQADLIPIHSNNAWVYGVALGDLPRALLQRKNLTKLNVVVLNPSVFLASLTHFDHSDWLSDQRVELHSGDDDKLNAPLTACPACLQLADESSARLRDRVFLELSTPYLNQRHASYNRDIQQQINLNEQFVEIDGDVTLLFNSHQNSSIMVAAAGPSLAQYLDKIISKRALYPLIAVNSALKPLVAAGITPDVVVVIDDDPKIISCFQDLDRTTFGNIPLVYFPRVPNSVLPLWPGPRLAAYSNHRCYADINKKYPRGILYSSGCVLHCAVDLAVQMGALQVILFGADFSFPNGKKYAAGAGWNDKEIPATQHWVLDGRGNRVSTSASFRGYLRDLEIYIEKHDDVSFYNNSKDGAYIKGSADWEIGN